MTRFWLALLSSEIGSIFFNEGAVTLALDHPVTDGPTHRRDFFVSFNQADRSWATWIAWVLEEAGYSVWFQDWDFRGNFVEHMNRAHTQAHRTLAVLSDDYFGSDFTLAE